MTVTFAHVLEEANVLVRELEELHAHCTRTGFVDIPKRIRVELDGWSPQDGAVPRYRWIEATLRGETEGARVDADAALPSYHLTFGDRVVIGAGLRHLRDVAGFTEALESGQPTLQQPLDVQMIPGIARGLPPDSGIRIVSAWQSVPASSFSTMLQSIRSYVFGMRT